MTTSLSNEAREELGKYHAGLAKSHGVKIDDVGKQFAVSPPNEKKIVKSMRESLEAMTKITVKTTDKTSGTAVRVGGGQVKGKRTDTKGGNRRNPTNLGGLTGSTWEAVDTEYDAAIDYDTIDEWVSDGNLVQELKNVRDHDIAMAKLTVGFYGESVAASPDPDTNELGEDVNKGWAQVLKEQKPENYMLEGVEGSGVIKIYGTNADFANLDSLVYAMYQSIPVHERTGNEIVIVGSALVTYDTAKVLEEHAGTPTEKEVLKVAGQKYAGLKAEQWPRFPDYGVWVTDPKNLQIIQVKGSVRRASKDEAEYSRLAEYTSSKDAYAIGNMSAIAMIDHTAVQLGDAAP